MRVTWRFQTPRCKKKGVDWKELLKRRAVWIMGTWEIHTGKGKEGRGSFEEGNRTRKSSPPVMAIYLHGTIWREMDTGKKKEDQRGRYEEGGGKYGNQEG